MSNSSPNPNSSLGPIAGKTCNLTQSLEILTHRAQAQLGPTAQTAFFLGDGLQRAATDTIFTALLPETWSPGNLLRAGSNVVRESARLFRLLAPGEAELAWQELKNKASVFALVKNLSSILHLSEEDLAPLPELVSKAYSLPAFEALWAVEGLGHYYTDKHWGLHGVPEGLLAATDASVPAKSLLMLHAGMGLCFADRLVGDLTTESSPSEVRAALEHFVKLCKNNARPGYLGAAIESLGIVTRDFYPDLFATITRQFQFAAPEFVGYYWHGIGRAIYFSRKFFLPHVFSMWGEVNVEAAGRAERQSALAGLTWAFTLVNMRNPAVVEAAVRAYATDSDPARAFANGVSSCLVMRSDTTPGEAFVSEFCQHRPRSQDHDVLAAWNCRVSGPAKSAVEAYYPALREHHALEQVFRYADLAQLVEQLKPNTPVASFAGGDNGCGCCSSDGRPAQ